jgi:hypothetical protein
VKKKKRKKNIFFQNQKSQFTSPSASKKTSTATGEAFSPQKGKRSISKNEM